MQIETQLSFGHLVAGCYIAVTYLTACFWVAAVQCGQVFGMPGYNFVVRP